MTLAFLVFFPMIAAVMSYVIGRYNKRSRDNFVIVSCLLTLCAAALAAVVLYNGSDRLLEKGAVKLRQGEELLVFSFSMLPPGARILVLENSGKIGKDMLYYNQYTIITKDRSV